MSSSCSYRSRQCGKASCILDERYPESQIKVYLRNVIKVFGYNKNISDITKELVYGGVGVEK